MKSYSLNESAQDNPAFTSDDGRSNGHSNGKSGDSQNGKSIDKDIEWKRKQEEEEEEEEEEEDPWTVTSLKQDYTPWSELTDKEKVVRAILYPVKIILVLGFLYLFICSLDFLSSAFKLLGGKHAGRVFQQSDILTNPVAGLMMGVLVTVLVQSSSTSTSIVISMVGAGILTAKTAVPIVMGANIGTSVTNTIVALGQITNKADFRRAFAGATVHDMFNWLTVIILLPLEVITGYLFKLSEAIVNSLHLNETLDVNQDLLKTITKPFTTLIIQVSSSGIKQIATGELDVDDATLMKLCCDKKKPKDCCKDMLEDLSSNKTLYGAVQDYTVPQRTDVCQEVDQCVHQDYTTNTEELQQCVSDSWDTANVTAVYKELNTLVCKDLSEETAQQDCCSGLLEGATFYTDFTKNATEAQQMALCTSVNSTCFAGSDVYDACTSAWAMGRENKGVGEVLDCGTWTETVGRTCNSKCDYLFRETHEKEGGPLSDEAVGGILLVIALVLLCVCLISIVKLLHSLLQGPMAKMIKTFVNADFPGYCGYFTGYLAILIGAGMTILVQSSSIFTSTLTPLVGLGVITLDRMYPLTLGSNIGTTATGILAALAQDVESIPRSLQVAFAHLFFNISGILLFYPIPFLRFPIPAAKFLGTTTAKYRWFAIVYLIVMFFLFPLAVFGLSIPGWYVLAIVLIPIAALVIAITVIKVLQAKKPRILPKKLQTWKFLPEPLRSLRPYDNIMKKLCFCARFQDKPEKDEERGGAGAGGREGGGAEGEEARGKTNQGFDDVVSTDM